MELPLARHGAASAILPVCVFSYPPELPTGDTLSMAVLGQRAQGRGRGQGHLLPPKLALMLLKVEW